MRAESTSKWTYLGEPGGRGGHHDDQLRFARNNESGELYLFDRSGENPDLTDDAPCRVLIHKPITIASGAGKGSKEIHCRVSVMVEDPEPGIYAMPIHYEAAMWLHETHETRILPAEGDKRILRMLRLFQLVSVPLTPEEEGIFDED